MQPAELKMWSLRIHEVTHEKNRRQYCFVVACCIDLCIRGMIGDEFARNAGYNEVGELNNIIIVYPQAIAVTDNPMGCWDWWGYTVDFFGT